MLPVLAQNGTSERPNILFILSDDHARTAISAYGGINAELAPTPHIDRLAEYEASSKDDPAAFDAAEYKIASERYGVTYSFEKLLNDVLERLSGKYTNREASTSG